MTRFHPNRVNQEVRDRLAENTLHPNHWILPLFVVEGTGVQRSIPGLDGTYHLSADLVGDFVKPFWQAGINKVLVFGVPADVRKTSEGAFAWSEASPVVASIRALKAALPVLTVMTDICLCAYTDHGHCGILTGDVIDNDATIAYLAQMAESHARAGADFVAPSAMMDGQVAAIAAALEKVGLRKAKPTPEDRSVKIMGYSAKFASGLYGPFRAAAGSKPSFGDRKTYQMDLRNGREALAEIEADVAEGADWVMVKPGLTYLDVIARAKDKFPDRPLAAYHTSGEFMMLKAAAAAGVFDYRAMLIEQSLAMVRAGADAIISYAIADWLEIHHD